MTRIALLSTSDTDLLSARASGADYLVANPGRPGHQNLAAELAECDVIVTRVLGRGEDLCSGFAQFRDRGAPLVVLGGEQTPAADLMELSTVPMGVAAQAHAFLAAGGPRNLAELHNFLSDTVLLTGEGFEPPEALPSWGVLERPLAATGHGLPRIGVLFYRAHHVAGNDQFAHDLADAIDATGEAEGVPIYCASLRSPEPALIEQLATLDALVVTVLAAGSSAGAVPAAVSAGGEDEAWDVGALADLDIPILQGLCLTWDRETWSDSDDGVSSFDAATQIAVPEFDGRLITTAFSFKEFDAEGLPRYVTDPERCGRVARTAIAHARLGRIPTSQKKLALVLSAYPTKHSRIGNAVGLDTPASAIILLRALRDAGYDVGQVPGLDEPDLTAAGNALIHALIERGGQDPDWLTHAHLDDGIVRISPALYQEWFDQLPAELAGQMREAWGEPPGDLYVNDDGELVLAALRFNNVVLMIQPPRGFGENPIAIYHDPDLSVTHHYFAAYRWLAHEFGADAVIHLGKHGSLEWLPGKGAALSADCAVDAVLGDLPLIYPFLVNDPGEGAQAKRRAHATIVDHLIPPMARAESYGDIARLEQLLDEYSNIAAMDPAKLPAIRSQIWTLIQAAKMDHDLGLTDRPDDEQFDDFLLHVDGWLCEVKDAQIRDGLHVLGQAPEAEARINLVLSILRANQVWGGRRHAVSGLRKALGLKDDAAATEVDRIEALARQLIATAEAGEWLRDSHDVATEVLGQAEADVVAVLDFARFEVVPRLAGTTAEITSVLRALDGKFVQPGPSGSPLRGLVNVLPTGRNFYTVDPKAVPSRLAYDTGTLLADSLLSRYQSETGEYPRSVGLSVWGTSAMRTSGDDVAEVLALLGVRPVWDAASRRVTTLEAIDLAELGRPRIDVTVRISGFFRDAFPHVVAMLDDAVQLVAGLDEPAEQNYVRAHVVADLAEHDDWRRASTRIFGSKPGSYGAGILQLVESAQWRGDQDLAEVYTTWGGFAYGRELDGVPADADMRTNFARIKVAVKNVDSREHDILDSDDYFQYHGGMIAAVRAFTGADPLAFIGDSTSPDVVRTRTLREETVRVFRSRVVNPRWIAAMRRHGYKGGFELAATVDYLFGYDVTTGVVADHMYEEIAQTYALEPNTQEFLREANPWALSSIIERLNEAHERELWQSPEPGTVAALQALYLELEGELEDR